MTALLTRKRGATLDKMGVATGRLPLVRLPNPEPPSTNHRVRTAEYGPLTRIYNRFNRWSCRGFGLKLLDALAEAGAVTKSTAIVSTSIKAQRAAFGAKRGA